MLCAEYWIPDCDTLKAWRFQRPCYCLEKKCSGKKCLHTPWKNKNSWSQNSVQTNKKSMKMELHLQENCSNSRRVTVKTLAWLVPRSNPRQMRQSFHALGQMGFQRLVHVRASTLAEHQHRKPDAALSTAFMHKKASPRARHKYARKCMCTQSLPLDIVETLIENFPPQPLNLHHYRGSQSIKCRPLTQRWWQLSALTLMSLVFVLNPSAGAAAPNTYTLKLYAHSHLLTTQEMRCIDELYTHESHWNPKAVNKHSGAYGIPQGMSTWLRTATPFEQIMWGIKYCLHRYGSMCGALNHWKAKGWH